MRDFGGFYKISRIIILPIYNESSTLEDVLKDLLHRGDILLLINDGSTDDTHKIAQKWAEKHSKIYYININQNQGKAHALKMGFDKILKWEKDGNIKQEDVIILIDADGQIPPQVIDRGCFEFASKNLDLLIGKRDFTLYPFIKKLGNLILSLLAYLLTGYPFKDTQCGFRIISVKALKRILPFYRAKRYACEQEISIIAALLKLKIDNSFVIQPAYYRSNSTFKDAIHITIDSFKTYFRVKTRRKKQ